MNTENQNVGGGEASEAANTQEQGAQESSAANVEGAKDKQADDEGPSADELKKSDADTDDLDSDDQDDDMDADLDADRS